MNNEVEIKSIALDKLLAHPDNPNRMSRANFGKLVRNIKRSGRYEPLVVRPAPKKRNYFQIINGHHRCQALEQLGYSAADCLIWDIDDEQTGIFLATLNRLGGSDELGKKLALLRRLNERIQAAELAKVLPQTAKQIERLANLKLPTGLRNAQSLGCLTAAEPFVFFVNAQQKQIIEQAISQTSSRSAEGGKAKMSKAARNAAALATIAQYFLNNSE